MQQCKWEVVGAQSKPICGSDNRWLDLEYIGIYFFIIFLYCYILKVELAIFACELDRKENRALALVG